MRTAFSLALCLDLALATALLPQRRSTAKPSTAPVTTLPSNTTTADRIHALLFGRVDRGGNSFPHMADVPLWETTHYLLEGPSHAQMLALLDDLLSQDVQKTLPDPRQRALLQQELWQVFDWTTLTDRFDASARVELRKPLAAAIRRVALTRDQIQSLPANLQSGDRADIPPDVTDASAGWVSIGIPGTTAIASVHLEQFDGRSAFGVFMHCPGGSQQAIDYLKALKAAPYSPPTFGATTRQLAQDTTPQFPEGTQLALLRRMMLIDTNGSLVASPITQSLQIRTFVKIRPDMHPADVSPQEFLLDRDRYLAGASVAMCPSDREPTLFLSVGVDWFEGSEQIATTQYRPPPRSIGACVSCHNYVGILSMNSYTRAFARNQFRTNPGLEDADFHREIEMSIQWKQHHASWGMLRGIWEASGKTG
jgi:hypothetical protein